jgi:pimeloyl-ACP methyl ester carboxylesterase
VVQEGLELMQTQLRSHGIDLQLELAAGLPPVMGDPYRLDSDNPPTTTELTGNTHVTLGDEAAGPAKAWLVEHRNDPRWKQCFDHAYGKRPREELYDLKKDPHQMHNVAADSAYASVVARLRKQLLDELNRTGDPRLVDGGRFFETPPMAGPAPKRLETKVFKIDGRDLYYHDEGSGASILILHGADLHIPGSWDRPIEALLTAGYRVIFAYRAGRGRSDPHPEFLSLARDARDMWALADHLALGRVVLVGHSQGAFVARDMLLKRPDRVAGVVSEDSSSFGKLGAAVARVGIDRFDAADRALYEKHKAALESLGRPWEYPSDYNVWRLRKRQRDRRPADEWKTQQVPDPNDAPVPKGKWCKAPLLVFAAGRGRIRPGDPEALALRERLPAETVRFVVVTKSGHGIHEEQTKIFNRELLAFLKRLR